MRADTCRRLTSNFATTPSPPNTTPLDKSAGVFHLRRPMPRSKQIRARINMTSRAAKSAYRITDKAGSHIRDTQTFRQGICVDPHGKRRPAMALASCAKDQNVRQGTHCLPWWRATNAILTSCSPRPNMQKSSWRRGGSGTSGFPIPCTQSRQNTCRSR